MRGNKKAATHWGELDNKRRALLTRWERYAAYTLPRICLPENFNEQSDELKHDWQAVGAQAVNHVVNKLMLTLFAPSRPFMRLELSNEARAELGDNIDDATLDDILATGERKAVRGLDARGDVRPALYQGLANLVVTGNALFKFPEKKGDKFRCLYSRDWAVQRSGSGEILRLVVRECYAFGELEKKVQDAYAATRPGKRASEKVTHYVVMCRNANGGYDLQQYVEDFYLGPDFDGSYKDYAALPYKVITWQLSDNADYGTGLVEDYAGDFAAVSAMSESQVRGAILSCEFRWLVNPAGMTKPEDLEQSENGAALPGTKDDVVSLSPDIGQNIQLGDAIMTKYVQRIGKGFLLGSAVTRDAERVTAEEIRMQAQELETSLGGAYTRIAVDLQTPIAIWLLAEVDVKVDGKAVNLSIVTGLDALSRNGDLEAMKAALADLAAISQLGDMMNWLEMPVIIATVFNGRGLSGAKYVKSAEKHAQEQQQREAQLRQQEVNAASAQAGAQVAANQAVNPQGQA